MIISGIQPLSLLDYPGVICSIVFTQGCPFRCGYCHNPDLIPVNSASSIGRVSEEEALAQLHRQKQIIEGVCITGGEPTIHADLPSFIKRIKQLGMLVKLDTNGVNPEMVKRLVEERLVDFIAMDIKHVWSRYAEVIGIKQQKIIDRCRETFHLVQSSSVAHEFRTTVYAGFHAQEDLQHIAGQLRAGERYALQAVRYEKMHNPDLAKVALLDLEEAASSIRCRYPCIEVSVRS